MAKNAWGEAGHVGIAETDSLLETVRDADGW
jgi:hypothetical protein